MRRTLAVFAPAVVAVALAGCGSTDNGTVTAASGGGSGSSAGGGTAYGGAARATASSTGAARIGTRHGRLGTFLVDRKGRTLYRFGKDKTSRSTCSGACAQNWPPALTTGKPTATGGVHASRLGTTRRSNGSRQVTYAGHPLYTFLGDSAPGQTNGQGLNAFGATWHVVAPSGHTITKG
jgi:predicted lipoprotein with Yx(FWY)xxD motif